MATTAGAGGDVHRVLYDAVAVCSASCAQRTTTNPTMKGAATPVTVGLDQAPQPHLTRLPIVSASASPTLSDHCTISWPPLTACSHLTRTYAATLGTGVFGPPHDLKGFPEAIPRRRGGLFRGAFSPNVPRRAPRPCHGWPVSLIFWAFS